MVYKTKSCPHCGKTYSLMQPEKVGVYGSPFKRCPSCGGSFIDKDFREIAVSGIRPVDRRRFAPGTALLGVFPLLFTLCGLFVGFTIGFDTTALALTFGGLAVLACVVWLVYGEMKGYNSRQEYLREEARRSEERLSNPQYALALKEIGYKVPKKYLPQDKE